ncbi:MAG: hypothetical protein HY530_03525 [Chloroflexi bacterium]|nr:hypothetical protein [Chloroflexota bacterium]
MSPVKLYRLDGQFIVTVNCQFHDLSDAGWWGEMVPTEYKAFSENDVYVLELPDGRRGRCSLRKLVNRAVNGVPPLYHYNFRGHAPFK